MTTGTGASQAFTASQDRERAQRAYMAGATHAAGMEPQLLPEGGRPLTELVVNAHYSGDLDEMRRLTLRAEAGLSPVSMTHLTDQQLEDRIGRIHVLLAAANDELQRRGRTRTARLAAERMAATERTADQCRPLDDSEA